MKHWPTKKLGEVAILNPKKSELKDLPDDLLVSFIPMSALDEITQTIKTNELRKLSNVRKGYTYFKEGDILFSKITPCMENGKVAVAKNLKNGIGFGSTEFHVLRPSDKVLSEWIFYIVGSIAFREEAKKHMTGTAGQQRVPIGFLENVKIPLPPLSEQKRIVEKIEKLFAKIDEAERLRSESLAASAALLPSALHQVFSRAKKANWPIKKLGEISRIFAGSSAPQAAKYFKNGKYPFLRVSDLNRGKIKNIIETRDYVNDLAVKELRLIKAKKNSIIFPKSGAAILTNSRAILGIDAYIVSHLAVVETNLSYALPTYLFLFLSNFDMRKLINDPAYPSLKLSYIEEIRIPVPPISEQKKIVAYLDALSQKSQELQKLQQQTAADFSALRQSILAEFFNQK